MCLYTQLYICDYTHTGKKENTVSAFPYMVSIPYPYRIYTVSLLEIFNIPQGCFNLLGAKCRLADRLACLLPCHIVEHSPSGKKSFYGSALQVRLVILRRGSLIVDPRCWGWGLPLPGGCLSFGAGRARQGESPGPFFRTKISIFVL